MKIKKLDELIFSAAPWNYNQSYEDVCDLDGDIISDLIDEPEGRLIAAAPDLYEACREVMLACDADALDRAFAKCRKALEKAGGVEL